MLGINSKDKNQDNVECYTLYDHSLKGANSMGEHLLCKQMDGGLIPSCPIMTKYTIKNTTKYLIKYTTRYATKYTTKHVTKYTKYVTKYMIKYASK